MEAKILFMTTEYSTLETRGGLGEVSEAIASGLQKLVGDNVRLLMLGTTEVLDKLTYPAQEIFIELDSGEKACVLETRTPDGIYLYVITDPDKLGNVNNIYSRENGVFSQAVGYKLFGLLSKVAAKIAQVGINSWRPNIVHGNDFFAAPAAYYISKMPDVKFVYGIHVVNNESEYSSETLDYLEIDKQSYGKRVKFMEMGLNYADSIIPVSNTYAQEISDQNLNLGCGMQSVFRANREKFHPIMNGADLNIWSPQNSSYLEYKYDANNLDNKEINKKLLRKQFGLEEKENTPIFCSMHRLDPKQKGIDLIIATIPTIIEQGGQLAIHGSADESIPEGKKLADAIREATRNYPGQVAFDDGYKPATAHLLFAGSDFIFSPSRFEPCGLSNIYGKIFGAVPIVRATGGLNDNVQDGVNGFKFQNYSEQDIVNKTLEAIKIYKNNPSQYQKIQYRTMTDDHSNDTMVNKYLELYLQLLKTGC